jgi:hypothetical protein
MDINPRLGAGDFVDKLSDTFLPYNVYEVSVVKLARIRISHFPSHGTNHRPGGTRVRTFYEHQLYNKEGAVRQARWWGLETHSPLYGANHRPSASQTEARTSLTLGDPSYVKYSYRYIVPLAGGPGGK